MRPPRMGVWLQYTQTYTSGIQRLSTPTQLVWSHLLHESLDDVSTGLPGDNQVYLPLNHGSTRIIGIKVTDTPCTAIAGE